MMISDETGEGKMTVHQILPGIMICFTDMHMEQCMSEFELNSGQKVLCIDQCREGRIEMEKIRAIHEQITSNLQVRVTIEELSKQYEYASNKHEKNVFVENLWRFHLFLPEEITYECCSQSVNGRFQK